MGDEPEEETPAEKSKYDQEFFLDLAAEGKQEWNKWRRDPANEHVCVTFAGVDFSEAPRDEINFAGFEFGDRVDFSGCKWRGVEWIQIRNDEARTFAPGRACFSEATFGSADFTGAFFGDQATFTQATFRRYVNFDGAAFGEVARFSDATFAGTAQFRRTIFSHVPMFHNVAFHGDAAFTQAAFGQFATFTDAIFNFNADFCGAAFGDGAEFKRVVFHGPVKFTGQALDRRTWDFGFEAALGNLHKDSWKLYGSGPDRFLIISFSEARFIDEAIFSDRSFEQIADFTGADFYYPPDFNTATNVGRIDFTGARISFVPPKTLLHWTKNSPIPVRMRAFRKVAEETKNHDLERDLYIEERKAERGVYLRQRWEKLKKEGWKNWPRNAGRLLAHVFWIIVMGAYWALADYGRSFVPPFSWLIASGFLFYLCYTKILAPLAPKACPLADKYNHAVRMLALGNAVPFVGPLTIDSEIKKFLFCPTGNCPGPLIPPEGYQLLVLSQNLLSITLIFFIGLALRNYFKIK